MAQLAAVGTKPMCLEALQPRTRLNMRHPDTPQSSAENFAATHLADAWPLKVPGTTSTLPMACNVADYQPNMPSSKTKPLKSDPAGLSLLQLL
jgi:hypothetical protein